MSNLTATIHLSPEDMVEACRTTPPTTSPLSTSKMRNRTRVVCISIMSAIIVATAMRMHAAELNLRIRLTTTSIALAAYWLFCWLFWLVREKWERFVLFSARRSMVFLAKLVYARKKGIFCDHTFIISEEGLTEITEVNHTLNPWADFKCVDISADFIVVRLLTGGAHFIPRRDFASEAEYFQFAQELRRHIPAGYSYDSFPVAT